MRRSNRFSFSYSLADIVRRVRVTNNILSPCDLEERRVRLTKGILSPCDLEVRRVRMTNNTSGPCDQG